MFNTAFIPVIFVSIGIANSSLATVLSSETCTLLAASAATVRLIETRSACPVNERFQRFTPVRIAAGWGLKNIFLARNAYLLDTAFTLFDIGPVPTRWHPDGPRRILSSSPRVPYDCRSGWCQFGCGGAPGRYPFTGIRLIYAESREPTSGLEPLTSSHYE
jgi:hypothetical protein